MERRTKRVRLHIIVLLQFNFVLSYISKILGRKNIKKRGCTFAFSLQWDNYWYILRPVISIYYLPGTVSSISAIQTMLLSFDISWEVSYAYFFQYLNRDSSTQKISSLCFGPFYKFDENFFPLKQIVWSIRYGITMRFIVHA